jgi:hypothetical protein
MKAGDRGFAGTTESARAGIGGTPFSTQSPIQNRSNDAF